MYCSMENSPSKSISDQTWKCLNSFKALNLESYYSLMVLFCLGIFFIVGGWVRKVSRFFSSATNLWSLLLCRATPLLVPATVPLSHEVRCKIALFAHVPLCRQMDKSYIHICNERFCVHKRSSANLSRPGISKFRPLGEVCLLPGLCICLRAKKPQCLFQNIWAHCKQVSKQISHVY